MNNDFFLESEMRYDEAAHRYFNRATGEEYKGVSNALKGIKVPFDREGHSSRMAFAMSKAEGISVKVAKSRILSEWDGKANGSIDKGNYCHGEMERFTKTGTCDDKMARAAAFLKNLLKEYYHYFPEVMIHSHTYKMAGRTDLALMRQKSKNPVIDFFDYKTNSEKGIQYDSIKRNCDPIKHYNKFFLPPFDYLEYCNYTEYSFQLSIYAFMAMERLNVRIGKLGIIFIDNNFDAKYIPVPFMYQEAKMLCEMNITRKALPTVSGTEEVYSTYSGTPSLDFDINNVTEDW